MSVLNRKQFRELWNIEGNNLGNWDSPLWIPENITGKKSRYFAMIRPIKYNQISEFNSWVCKYCRGQILCYSVSDEDQEAWYGFSHKADILLFLLRW